MTNIRRPICTVIGHVDHGKTAILDNIRHTSIVAVEAGKITQAIGASIIPLETVKKISGKLLEKLKLKFTIPGLLFIDTPGHAAFTNLRKRGGNLADIAILVIDVNEGFKEQSMECIEILKTYKTPFIIAANKIDLIQGWQNKDKLLLETIKEQGQKIQEILDRKLYEIVGKLSELGFNSERFDRVEDYTKQIAIVPTSAKTGDGIPELLMVITGLAQKYLEKGLKYNVKGEAKGTILEVKEQKGIGKIIDVIIYDGNLKVDDTIVVGTLDEPITTKVRALFEPLALAEMRDKRSKFKSVKAVYAATGVRISAPDLDKAVAGMPVLVTKEVEKTKKEIKKTIQEVLIETDKTGIIVKADSLGSLEAVVNLLKEKKIPIRKASIGDIQKKDLGEALTIYEEDPTKAVVLGFNVKDISGICYDNVKLIIHDVIYKLIEDLEKWQIELKKQMEAKALEALVMPAKIQIMKGYVFRQNNPAVVGVDVLEGVIKPGIPLMKADGKVLTEIKSIQSEQESISKAEKGKQVAIALPKVTVGRQIIEGDVLYSAISEKDFRKLKELKRNLKKEDIALLKEIAEIKRKNEPMWGV